MIYTVISDYRKLLPEILTEEGGIDSPFSLLPEVLKEYIKKPKNEDMRLSRLGGYLLLFHTVRFLFGEFDFDIDFNENGKPYFKNGITKGLSFNISNCEGLCAVTLSDDISCVGVDIQSDISEEREKKLKERFFNGKIDCRENIEVIYLFAGFSAYGDCMFAEIPITSLKHADPNECFSDRWSLCEALMKCDGRGFGAIGDIGALLEELRFQTVGISYKGKRYSLSTAVKQ